MAINKEKLMKLLLENATAEDLERFMKQSVEQDEPEAEQVEQPRPKRSQNKRRGKLRRRYGKQEEIKEGASDEPEQGYNERVVHVPRRRDDQYIIGGNKKKPSPNRQYNEVDDDEEDYVRDERDVEARSEPIPILKNRPNKFFTEFAEEARSCKEDAKFDKIALKGLRRTPRRTTDGKVTIACDKCGKKFRVSPIMIRRDEKGVRFDCDRCVLRRR